MKKPDIKGFIANNAFINAIVGWMQKTSFPGFMGIPIYDVLKFIQEELKQEHMIARANSMAFSFFLSLFPTMLFLFTLLPYLRIKNFIITLKDSIGSFFPENAANYLYDIIDTMTTKEYGGLLSLGFFAALFFGSNGMLAMMRGFEKRHEVSFKRRNMWQKRWKAIQLLVIMGFLVIVSVLLIFMGRNALIDILEWVGLTNMEASSILVFRGLLAVVFVYAGISILYSLGSSLKKNLHFFSPGATLATILSLLTSLGFSYYVNSFALYNKIYGSIGALIVLLLWIQLNCIILLIGFELNASIAVNRDLRIELGIFDWTRRKKKKKKPKESEEMKEESK